MLLALQRSDESENPEIEVAMVMLAKPSGAPATGLTPSLRPNTHRRRFLPVAMGPRPESVDTLKRVDAPDERASTPPAGSAPEAGLATDEPRWLAVSRRVVQMREPRTIAVTTLIGVLVCALAIGVAFGTLAARLFPAGSTSANSATVTLPLASAAPPQGAPSSRVRAAASPTTLGGASAEAADKVGAARRIVVHAAGAVRNPGVYELPSGSRVADAVQAAGGFAPDADPDRVNLAAPLNDADRVLIPTVGLQAPTVSADQLSGPSRTNAQGGVGSVSASGPLDLNTATIEQLDALPGVGPATAAAIVAHRTRIGKFAAVSQLLDVPGIGEAKLAAIKPKVSVGK